MTDRHQIDVDVITTEGIPAEVIPLLKKDMVEAAEGMTARGVRTLVDTYYMIQDMRKATGNQMSAIMQSEEPDRVLGWVERSMEGIENMIRGVMDQYTKTEPTGMGMWARNVFGIGPVLSAGLLAHIDMTKAKSPAHIWRFAGLDPTIVWHSSAEAEKLVGEVLSDPAHWDTSTRPLISVPNRKRIAKALQQVYTRNWDAVLQSILDDVDLGTGDGSEDVAMTNLQIIALGRHCGVNAEEAFRRLRPILVEVNEDTSPPMRPAEITMDQIVAIAGAINVKPENFLRFAPDKKTEKVTEKSLARAVSRRPYNAKLKVLSWKIGESFIKFHNNPKCVYGFLYTSRKYYEQQHNENGDYVDAAAAMLKRFRIGHDTEAYKAYIQGKLPPGHINSRARRYAVKRFLADWWAEAYRNLYGKEPPEPYAIAHLGHVDWDSAIPEHRDRWPMGEQYKTAIKGHVPVNVITFPALADAE